MPTATVRPREPYLAIPPWEDIADMPTIRPQNVWRGLLLGLAGLATTACADSSPADPETEARTTETEAAAESTRALPDFTGIVEEHREAVVNISTTRQAGGKGPRIPERFKGTPFEEFFERFFGGPGGGPGGGPERKVRSLGSGFIVSADGHIVTNAHVIKGASEVMVQLADQRQLEATVIGQDMATDLALLKVDAEGLPTVEWASGSVQVGQHVLAMGSPFGFKHSVTSGIVSAEGRSIPGKAGGYVPFLQTDVAINPGSSGGPLFNLDGEVVGVNAQIYSRSGGFMGLSFAIPSDVAQGVIQEIKANGDVTHGYLGVGVQDINRELADSMALEDARGGLINRVYPDSPADKAGLQSGDIILAVDGESVAEASDIPPLIGSMDPGSEAALTIMRSGDRLEKAVTLGALREARNQSTSATEPTSALGMLLAPVPEQLRQQRPLPEEGGALIKGMQEGPAQQSGLRPGDVLLKLGDEPVRGPGMAAEVLSRMDSGSRIPVLVQRGRQTLFLPLLKP